MPVVELKRGEDQWYLQVGEEHLDPENNPHANGLSVEDKALLVANGNGNEFKPGNGEPGWEVVEIHDDNRLQELQGVTNRQLGIMPPVQRKAE